MALNPYVSGFVRQMRPADRRPVWQWCEDNITVDDTSPFPGRWKSSRSPWAIDVMVAWRSKKYTVVLCSAQSAKTLISMNCSCYAIVEDPGPAMWVMAAADEAGDFMRDRIVPTFTNCKPVSELAISVKGMSMVFRTMPFYFVGSHSPSKLQSKPIRYLFLDEIRNYPPGALELVKKRTRAFWNQRTLMTSTPDTVGDSMDVEYKLGDQRVWHYECPKCGTLQPLEFENLKWDKNETTCPGGVWRFDDVAQSIRLVCVACQEGMKDTPANRRHIYKGKFVATNPHAASDRASFHWNAMLPMWVEWRTVVEEYLTAVHAAFYTDPPDFEPLKKFYCETLGVSYEAALGVITDFEFLSSRKRDYDFGSEWPEEKCRFMAADKQAKGGEHYWWLIRAFGERGASRLVAYGRCNTYDELEQIRTQHNVPVKNAMIDHGYKGTEVARWCARSKWKMMKGDTAQWYLHSVMGPKGIAQTVRRLWQLGHIDPHIGTSASAPNRHLPLYRFSSETVKDFFAEMMQGLVGDWTFPKNVGKDYMQQITAEHHVSRTDAKGRIFWEWRQIRPDNHLGDCELMILVAAVINDLLPAGVVRAPSGGADARLFGDGKRTNDHGGSVRAGGGAAREIAQPNEEGKGGP